MTRQELVDRLTLIRNRLCDLEKTLPDKSAREAAGRTTSALERIVTSLEENSEREVTDRLITAVSLIENDVEEIASRLVKTTTE